MRRRTIATLLAAGLLAAAGCGDDDDEGTGGGAGGGYGSPETQAQTTGGGGGGEARRVVLTEFAIDPANPKAKAGKVTFDVVNEGSAPHALEIEGGGEEFETEVLDGGESATLEANLDAGEYEWYCPVGNHADQGMKGKLTVE